MMLAHLRSLAAKFFHRSDLAQDMQAELRAHIQHRADDLERSGLPRAEAERQARIEFGGAEKFADEGYEALGGNMADTFLHDIRLSIRGLRKSPSFAITAVTTLALAIGANAVVFGVLNALILRPINVPRPASLYAIERGPDKAINHSYPDYADLRDRNHGFEDLAAYNLTAAVIDKGNDPSPAWVMETTGNYFDALHEQPYLGRFFHAADDHGPNSAPYIVLTYAYWSAEFQGDRRVIGQVVQLNQHPFTIIGVASPEFRGTLAFVFPHFWVPIVNQEQVEGANVLQERGSHVLLMVLGHLKTGVTPAQAIADLNSIGSSLEKSYPKDDAHMNFTLTRPGLAGDWFGGPVTEFLGGLMLLAGLILLAACVNLGSLFAARAADRSREIALRLSLGSSRRRILRGLFTEAVLISLLGGAVGLWGSVILLNRLSVWHPLPAAPLTVAVNPDANVYAMALLLALASGFLFGAVPVRQVLQTNPYELVKGGSAKKAGRMTVREVMLVSEIAICAVLVTSSLVAVRGLMRSLQSDVGFQPQDAMVVHPARSVGSALSMTDQNADAVASMQKHVIDQLEAIPGVKSVGSVDRLPLYFGANSSRIFSDTTSDLRPANAAAEAMTYRISPGYLGAAKTTLLAGRDLTWHDDNKAPRVAVVNREFARKMFTSVSRAIGNYYKMPDGARVQVVGIVEDGKYATLAEDPQVAMFLPVLQLPINQTAFVVRYSGDPESVTAGIRSTMHELDAGNPITIQAWSKELESALFAPRVATVSLGVLGIMGAMLSITGIFGMAAYAVTKRMRELGIRVALGAKRNEVLQTALGRAFILLASGSAGGLILGILASRVLGYIVYQATPRDPLVLAGVVFAMSVVGLLATWIPAQRALGVDPMVLLREE